MFWRRSVADQVDEELDFHLEMVTRDLTARGWSEPDAHAEARRRFGDLAEVGSMRYPDRPPRIVARGESLDGEDVVPGFALALAELFGPR